MHELGQPQNGLKRSQRRLIDADELGHSPRILSMV